jgi:hypothetical protein
MDRGRELRESVGNENPFHQLDIEGIQKSIVEEVKERYENRKSP